MKIGRTINEQDGNTRFKNHINQEGFIYLGRLS